MNLKEIILSIGDRLLFDNIVTKWIEKEAKYLNDYVKDCCDPERIPKKKTIFIVIRFVLLFTILIIFCVFSNLLAIPLCLLDDTCSGRSKHGGVRYK